MDKTTNMPLETNGKPGVRKKKCSTKIGPKRKTGFACLKEDTIATILHLDTKWLHDEDLEGKFPPIFEDENFVNEHWDPVIGFTDYGQYKDRFHTLYMLELWEQISQEYHECPFSQTFFTCTFKQDGENYPIFEIRRSTVFGDALVLDREDLLMLSCNGQKHLAMVAERLFHIDLDLLPADDSPFQDNYSIILKPGTKLSEKVKIQVVMKLQGSLRLIQALHKFKDCSLRKQILDVSIDDYHVNIGKKRPILSQIPLNDSQKRVVQRISNDIMDTRDIPRVYLVHGPPGTGKSQTILALVCQLYSMPLIYKFNGAGAILVCAPSNGAVDTLVRKFLNQIEERNFLGGPELKVVRIGGSHISEDLKPYSLHALAKQFKMGKEIPLSKAKKHILRQAHIIFGTLNSFGTDAMEAVGQILCAVVDEASQANELELLVPLQFPGNKKLVLVGDHHQLPPTILSEEARYKHFNLSLFDRFRHNLATSEKESPMLLLDTQYRMVNNIATFPATYIYDRKLRTPPTTDPMYPKTPDHYKLNGYRVIDTHDHGKTEEKDDYGSTRNQNEALIVAEVCKKVLACSKVTTDDMGIITFYKAQVELIKKVLGETSGLAKIEVNTVDGYQGREKGVIILSCVRGGNNNIGFVQDRRRMNVAITRAKYGLYIIGHCFTLGVDFNWRTLIKNASTRQSVIKLKTKNYSEQLEILKLTDPEPVEDQKVKNKKYLRSGTPAPVKIGNNTKEPGTCVKTKSYGFSKVVAPAQSLEGNKVKSKPISQNDTAQKCKQDIKTEVYYSTKIELTEYIQNESMKSKQSPLPGSQEALKNTTSKSNELSEIDATEVVKSEEVQCNGDSYNEFTKSVSSGPIRPKQVSNIMIPKPVKSKKEYCKKIENLAPPKMEIVKCFNIDVQEPVKNEMLKAKMSSVISIKEPVKNEMVKSEVSSKVVAAKPMKVPASKYGNVSKHIASQPVKTGRSSKIAAKSMKGPATKYGEVSKHIASEPRKTVGSLKIAEKPTKGPTSKSDDVSKNIASEPMKPGGSSKIAAKPMKGPAPKPDNVSKNIVSEPMKMGCSSKIAAKPMKGPASKPGDVSKNIASKHMKTGSSSKIAAKPMKGPALKSGNVSKNIASETMKTGGSSKVIAAKPMKIPATKNGEVSKHIASGSEPMKTEGSSKVNTSQYQHIIYSIDS